MAGTQGTGKENASNIWLPLKIAGTFLYGPPLCSRTCSSVSLLPACWQARKSGKSPAARRTHSTTDLRATPEIMIYHMLSCTSVTFVHKDCIALLVSSFESSSFRPTDARGCTLAQVLAKRRRRTTALLHANC